jgi:hypothetical protein
MAYGHKIRPLEDFWMLRESLPRSRPLGGRAAPEARLQGVLCGVPANDWRMVVSSHPNMLLEGAWENSERLIRALASDTNALVLDWREPWPAEAPAIIVARDVDMFGETEQHQLLDRLDGAGKGARTCQVVSTSAQRLFDLVEQGQFREDLYYRLNIVHFDVGQPYEGIA